MVSFLLIVGPIVTFSSSVSRAPPNHTLPAFLNLHDMQHIICYKTKLFIIKPEKCDCVFIVGGNGHKLNASLIDYENEYEQQIDLSQRVRMPD